MAARDPPGTVLVPACNRSHIRRVGGHAKYQYDYSRFMFLRVCLAVTLAAGGILAALVGVPPVALVVAGAGGLLALAGTRASRW